jgi:SAM-dependent methyltransferase
LSEAAGPPYGRSAAIYDLLYVGAGIKDFRAEADEVDRLIRARNPQAATLLDVACGTGKHLSYLRERYEVEGVDASTRMLEVARARLPGVPLHLADMSTFDLGRNFDAVICMFSGIGYLTQPDGMRAAFGRFADHLAPGGVLVVDGWVRPEGWKDGHLAEMEHAAADGVEVYRLVHSRREGRITTLTEHHLVRSSEGIEHFVETHVLALTPTDEYVRAAEAAGLRVEVLANYMPERDRIVGVKSRKRDLLDLDRRRAALDAALNAAPMDVPDPDDLKPELDEIRGRAPDPP